MAATSLNTRSTCKLSVISAVQVSQNKRNDCLNIWVNMHFRCRVWQVRILDVIHHVLLMQHCSDLYEVMRHKNATHRHLPWYSSCHLMRWVAVRTPVGRETSCTRAIQAQWPMCIHFNSFKMPQNDALGSCRCTVFSQLKEIVVNKLLGIIQ